MPGVDPDGVNIMLEKRVLTITGRSSRSVAPEGHSLTHHEYRDGDYERAFISEAIDADNIQAELKDGVFGQCPKSQPAPAKTIQVKAARDSVGGQPP